MTRAKPALLIDAFDRTRLSARATRWTCAALWLLGFALFAKSIGFGFTSLDTETVLLSHPRLYDETSFFGAAYEILVGYFPREEPLLVRDLSWALDSRLFGFRNPLGYHLGNVLLHACNVVLVFLLVVRSTHRSALALGSALLFAVVPIHVQAVSWEMGRKDVLVALWMLLALCTQHSAIEHAGTARGRRLELATLALVILAMLSKLSGITLFLLLALQRVMQPYLDGRLGPRAPFDVRAAVRALWPSFPLQLAVSFILYKWYAANLAAFGVIGDRGPPAFSAEHLSTLSRYVPLSLTKNLVLIGWPYGYSIMYQYPNTNLAPAPQELAVAYATVALLALGVLVCAWLRRDALFLLLAFGVLLVPYLNIEYIGYWVADRYLYLASLPPIMLAVAGLLALARRVPPVAPLLAGAFAVLTAFYAVRALACQESYRDNLALWRYETSLPRPSVWSFASLARETSRRAKAAAPGADRERWLRETHRAIERGLELYRSLPLLTTRYRMTERLHAGAMHLILGTIAPLEGKPLAVELQHYRDGHALAMTSRSALKIAEITLRMAGDAPEAERSKLVRESFRYYAQFVGYVARDPAARRDAGRNLMVYMQFPELRSDVQALAERYLR